MIWGSSFLAFFKEGNQKLELHTKRCCTLKCVSKQEKTSQIQMLQNVTFTCDVNISSITEQCLHHSWLGRLNCNVECCIVVLQYRMCLNIIPVLENFRRRRAVGKSSPTSTFVYTPVHCFINLRLIAFSVV